MISLTITKIGHLTKTSASRIERAAYRTNNEAHQHPNMRPGIPDRVYVASSKEVSREARASPVSVLCNHTPAQGYAIPC